MPPGSARHEPGAVRRLPETVQNAIAAAVRVDVPKGQNPRMKETGVPGQQAKAKPTAAAWALARRAGRGHYAMTPGAPVSGTVRRRCWSPPLRVTTGSWANILWGWEKRNRKGNKN